MGAVGRVSDPGPVYAWQHRKSPGNVSPGCISCYENTTIAASNPANAAAIPAAWAAAWSWSCKRAFLYVLMLLPPSKVSI